MLPKGWSTIGIGLDRPECVVLGEGGALYVSHRGHGVCRIDADGTQTLLATKTEYGGQPILPNGITKQDDGSFLIANISDAGGIHRLACGKIAPYMTILNGSPMPPVNFVTTDDTGRVWFSVSSTLSPRHLAYQRDVKNGFVGVIENGQARVVLDGLHYTNEIRVDFDAGWLYVSETFSQRISRFPISRDLEIGAGEIFAQFPKGAFVDGIALDENGGVFAACIVSNEIYHVTTDGKLRLIASERDDNWVKEVETALDNKSMTRAHFDTTPAQILKNVSSVVLRKSEKPELICGALLSDRLVRLPLNDWTV